MIRLEASRVAVWLSAESEVNERRLDNEQIDDLVPSAHDDLDAGTQERDLHDEDVSDYHRLVRGAFELKTSRMP